MLVYLPVGAIDWKAVDNYISLPECVEPSVEEKANLVCSHETHEKTIVKPWYKFLLPDQVLIPFCSRYFQVFIFVYFASIHFEYLTRFI